MSHKYRQGWGWHEQAQMAALFPLDWLSDISVMELFAE